MDFYTWRKKLYAPNGDSWPAASGGLAEHLPPGEYDIGKTIIDTRPDFCDSAVPGSCWFIRLTPRFKIKRRGFGVHPDGGPPGTHGCIGLQPGCDMQRARGLLEEGARQGDTLRVIP